MTYENNPIPQADGHSEITEIVQTIALSQGTKAICTACKREDAHTLILRRRRGLYELLCKQNDGSGCYPNYPRVNCKFQHPEGYLCLQLAEYEVCSAEDGRYLNQACADHLGDVLPSGNTSAWVVYPLED